MDFLKLIHIRAPASLEMSIACQRFRLFDKRPIMYALMLIGKWNVKLCRFVKIQTVIQPFQKPYQFLN